MDSIRSALERSRLLTPAHWRQLDREPALEGEALLAELVRRTWVTPWQAEMLRRDSTGFFVGQYKLLDCIGTGGNGHVFKAEHSALGRTVALKVLAPAVVKNRQAIARFQHEMHAAALLDHPHIVRAWDAGSAGEVHFLVMEYVPGRNLGELVEAYGPLPVGFACECLRQAALALQHAHERGMVHRDIKPSNLLVTQDRETGLPIIKLLDLGLARFVSESVPDSGLTQSGQVLGTPDYISPEQAADTRTADIRSDIFSLGCTLFRLLTGTVPYGGQNVMEKLMARATHDAPLVRTRRADVPAGLEAVLARMLDRERAGRFQTPADVAQALAPWADPDAPPKLQQLVAGVAEVRRDASGDDGDSNLDRFLRRLMPQGGDDVTRDIQRKPSPTVQPAPEAAFVPARRRGLSPRWMALSGSLMMLIVLCAWAGSTMWGSWGMATIAIDWPADRDGTTLEFDRRPYPPTGAGPIIVHAAPGPHQLRALRAGYEPVELLVTLARNEERRWVPKWSPTRESVRQQTLREIEKRVSRSAENSGGTRTALLAGDGELQTRLLDFARSCSGTPEALAAARLMSKLAWPLDRLSREQIPLPELRGVGTGDRAPLELVGVLGDSRLRHWNEVRLVAVSASGELIASGSSDGTVGLWDSSTGNLLHKLYVGEGRLSLQFAPRGTLLATAVENRPVAVWDGATGDLLVTLAGAQRPFAFSHDSQWLVADSATNRLGLWQLPEGTPHETLPRRSGLITRILCGGTSQLAALEYGDDVVQLIDLKQLTVRGTYEQTRRPMFSPDDTLLAAELTFEKHRSDLAFWQTDTGQQKQTLNEAGEPTLDKDGEPVPFLLDGAGEPIAFLADGKTLASMRPGRVILWNLQTGNELRTLRDIPEVLAISPDRQWLATGDRDFGSIHFWNLVTGTHERAEGHLQGISAIAFSPDSAVVVTASRDHSLKLWNVAAATERQVAASSVGPVDISPDGRTLVFASDDGSIKLWDVATGKSSRTLEQDARAVRRLEFSPNGRLIACVGDWGFFQFTLRLWDAGTGEEISYGGDPLGTVRAFAISPDSKRLAIASAVRAVVLIDLETKQLSQVIEDDFEDIQSLAFSPDGTLLAVAGRTHPVVLWDIARQQREKLLQRPAWPMTVVAFAPDGQHLAAGTELDHVIVWDARTGEVERTLSAPGRWITSLCYRPDGQSLAAVNNAGRLHLWELADDARQRTASRSDTTPTRTFTLGPPGAILQQCQYSPEGRHILSVNGNGTVYVLRLNDR